jgi:uncharacterized membrane protein YfcA
MLFSVNLTAWQWILLALGAFFTGLSKTGIAGIGVISVALFANALPARVSTGALLPLLLCADAFGLVYYRKHASWPHLWKLFPWVIPGVFAGYFALDRINSIHMQRLLGGILLAMVALHYWRKKNFDPASDRLPHDWWVAAITGVLAGFTTMVANAAGPVMVMYLLAVGLPKLTFIGTGAWFFMLVNAFKVPFSLHLGLITPDSLKLDALLLLPMIPGALLGPVILRRVNQTAFENMVLFLTVVASLRLLISV